MKKIYSAILFTAFAFTSFTSNAATVNIVVGFDGTGIANAFFPTNATANVGDVIMFSAAAGGHNSTSGVIPGGAASFAHSYAAFGDNFSYTVTVAGVYNYSCTLHTGMVGTITVSATGIATPAVDLLTNVYPNPFKDKVTLKYNEVEAIDLYNIVGEKVKAFELPSNQSKIEVDLSDLNTGVYFIRTYKEGTIVETKKIIKTK